MTGIKSTGSLYMDGRRHGSLQALDYLAERNKWFAKLSMNTRHKFLQISHWWSFSWIGRKYYDLFERGE